jgi:Rrf2 family protein
MISRKAKYGLKAMLRLATEQGAGPMLVATLADAETIPKKFLEQILLELKHHGLLQSKKGKGGGYMLARPASEISIGEVIRTLDGPIALIPCVSQTAYVKCDECQDERTCGIRLVMKEVRDAMVSILDGRSLADVGRAVAAVGATPSRGGSHAAPLSVRGAARVKSWDVTLPFPARPRRARE